MISHRYDIALSFAGEDRELAQYIADKMKHDYRVFYDHYERAVLWGEDLSEALPERYVESRYCLILHSEEYLEKVWTTLERQALIFEFLRRRGRDYLLPVRVRGCTRPIPGISGLTSYFTVHSCDDWATLVSVLQNKIRPSLEGRS